MKNYFVFVNYYLPNRPKPLDCDSMLITGHDDCLKAWNLANKYCHNYMKENGYSKFTISEFNEVK